MTLPTSGTQFLRPMQRRFRDIQPAHPLPGDAPAPISPSQPLYSVTRASEVGVHEHAINFATHSWDLATGGLKTLTAKRELPTRLDRRASGVLTDPQSLVRSYTFALVTLTCVLLMLLGVGVVLIVMLQP